MAHKLVEIAVEARLRAQSPVPAVFVENVLAEALGDASRFLVLQFPVADVSRWAVNERAYREIGAFRIVVHIERGVGMTAIRDLGESLASIFCDEKFDGVQCRVPAPPFVDDSTEGPMIWASIVVPYEFNFAR